MVLWIEFPNWEIKRCTWDWPLARLTIWKTEFRLGLDLSAWCVGLGIVEIDDFSMSLGPFDIQVETCKGFD